MLVITRKPGESLRIGSGDNAVTVKVWPRGKGVKLGIEAPSHMPIVRTELDEDLPEESEGADDDAA